MYSNFAESLALLIHWYYYSDIVRSNGDVLIIVWVERRCAYQIYCVVCIFSQNKLMY